MMLISEIIHDIGKLIISAVPFTTIEDVVAAHAAENAPAESPATHENIGNGDLARPLLALSKVAAKVAAVSDGSLIVYRMAAIRGGQTTATAMLFLPKGAPPAGGGHF